MLKLTYAKIVIAHVNHAVDKDLLTAQNVLSNITTIFKEFKQAVYKYVIQINMLIAILNHVLYVIAHVKLVLVQRKLIVVYVHKTFSKNKMDHVF